MVIHRFIHRLWITKEEFGLRSDRKAVKGAL